MKIVIIGGVAGGATAAARARRISETAEITLVERGPYVSFANCGLPYFLSGDIPKRSHLLLQTPEGFWARYGVRVLLNTEAVELDRGKKTVLVRSPDGSQALPYDRLILAQGGQPIFPPLPGSDAAHVFKLWTVPDMDRIDQFLKTEQPRSAVVVGGGFIGLEMAEAFHRRGLKTTVVERESQVMPLMDPEIGFRIRETLEAAGLQVVTGTGLKSVNPETKEVELGDGRRISADLVLFSVGVRPELDLVKKAGLEIGESGGLKVDRELRTSDPAIYAAGDMVEVPHRISARQVRLPLAGPANRQGRIAATNTLGGHENYRGVLGTSVVKVLEYTAASTGLTEKSAREAGFDATVAVVHKDHHAGYFPGAKLLTLKLIYDRKTGRILGAQAFGQEGVDKRIDVLATALAGRLTLEDLADLDLAYAPPYSSANDPLNMAAFVGANNLSGFSPTVTTSEWKSRYQPAAGVVVDVRNRGEHARGHVPGSRNIPVDELRDRLAEIPRDQDIFVHCQVGFRGHLAARILKEHQFDRVWNITGGYQSMRAEPGFVEEK